MLNKILCFFTNHSQVILSTEQLKGKEFRYHSACRCGENKKKSVPLNDNDLLSNINITDRNFPVEA